MSEPPKVEKKGQGRPALAGPAQADLYMPAAGGKGYAHAGKGGVTPDQPAAPAKGSPAANPAPAAPAAPALRINAPAKPGAAPAPRVVAAKKPETPAAPPAPKPAAKPSAPPAAPAAKSGKAVQAQSRAMAQTVVSSFVDRLTAEAGRKGGVLTVDDLKGLDGEFKKKAAALEAIFAQSIAAAMRAQATEAEPSHEHERHDYFGRLMVKRFAHLLAGSLRLGTAEGALSRRLLPGFFLGLEKMLGEEELARCRAAALELGQRLRSEKGDAFAWDDFYAHPEARELTTRALVAMAAHFTDLDKRREWFKTLVNGNLAPLSQVADEGEAAAGWQIGDADFHAMLDALYGDLRLSLENAGLRKALTGRYGDAACAHVEALLARLAAARAAERARPATPTSS
jgi:hypothetical protein